MALCKKILLFNLQQQKVKLGIAINNKNYYHYQIRKFLSSVTEIEAMLIYRNLSPKLMGELLVASVHENRKSANCQHRFRPDRNAGKAVRPKPVKNKTMCE